MSKQYIRLIAELKRSIIQSRYVAARLANREQLLLYFKTGKMLAEKIAAEKWGMKILVQISEDLQKQLPGLRGFSQRNLINMKHFYNEYQSLIITQSVTAKIRNVRRTQPKNTLPRVEAFFGISFTHHICILNKCESQEERYFYISEAAAQFWSVNTLEHYINANLFSQQGKLPNNFEKTLPEQLHPSALKIFQDEYLMDFMTPGEIEDERVLEEKVVSDIKNFTMKMGQGFSFIGNQYRIELDGEEFFVDLLFFNRHLRCSRIRRKDHR
ncbi:MAG TPA: PDDEXK nuclease domain-containing protein [Puia sp.]|nr:PDDEXK nuclease domain-containing protein [Puia sp.]